MDNKRNTTLEEQMFNERFEQSAANGLILEEAEEEYDTNTGGSTHVLSKSTSHITLKNKSMSIPTIPTGNITLTTSLSSNNTPITTPHAHITSFATAPNTPHKPQSNLAGTSTPRAIPSLLVNSNEITLGAFESSGMSMPVLPESAPGTLVGGMCPARVGHIFDHFIVVGLPSTTELTATVHDERQVHDPQVIYKYPESDLPNDMIEQFCFPSGITSRSSQRSYSSSSLNQIAFCNLSHLLLPQNSFIFLITTQTDLYYGMCIIKEEEVATIPNFIDPNSELNQVRKRKNSTVFNGSGSDDESKTAAENGKKKPTLNREQFDFIAPRVYCMISRFPLFQLHFQMLHAILESERMLMLFSMSQSIDPGLTTRAIDILNLYYNITMENIKDRIQFKIPSHDYKMDFHCPVGSEDRLIADWSIYTTFQILPIEDILNVFGWILLERQVLVVSKHLGNVSSLVFSLISLLKPFTWQCCFIPVLPDSLLESLEAPFPFIIGYNTVPEDIMNSKHRDYLIVDIDNKKLHYPEKIEQVYLPGNKKLVTTLISHKKECSDLLNQIPIDHLKHRFTQNILSTFRDYQTWLVDQISFGVITCINNLYIFEIANQQHQQQHQNDILADENENINENINNLLSNAGDDNLIDNQSPVTSPTQQSLLTSLSTSTSMTSIPNTPRENGTNTNVTPPQIDGLKSIELLNKQSIHFLENPKNIEDIVTCLPDKYQNYFRNFFHTQMFAVNAVKLMLSIQERHKTSISLIEKLESLIQMEEKSKEVLMEYQRIAKKENNKANVDMNILKKQLKDSEGVINELRESKKKLEMEALATSPSKGNSSISNFLGISSVNELRKKKLEFGHRRSRSVTDQVEKNILKKSLKPPSLSFFGGGNLGASGEKSILSTSTSNLMTSSSSISMKASSPTASTLSGSSSILDIMEKVDQQLQQSQSQSNTPPNPTSPIKTPRSGANSPSLN